MAAHYIDALRRIQPEGPYILGGWSLGGIIAYEMAQRLVAQGQRVSQLLLLDSTPWAFEREYVEEDDALILMNLLFGGRPNPGEDLQPFRDDEQIDHVLEKAISANLLPPDLEVDQVRSFLNVYRANLRAAHNYVLQVYSGAVTLFKPSDGPSHGEWVTKTIHDPTKGWGALAVGGVRIVDVPGHHYSMMSKPHVETLALRIRAYITEAETVSNSPTIRDAHNCDHSA